MKKLNLCLGISVLALCFAGAGLAEESADADPGAVTYIICNADNNFCSMPIKLAPPKMKVLNKCVNHFCVLKRPPFQKLGPGKKPSKLCSPVEACTEMQPMLLEEILPIDKLCPSGSMCNIRLKKAS